MKQTFEIETEGDLTLSVGFVRQQLVADNWYWDEPKVTEITTQSTQQESPPPPPVELAGTHGKRKYRCTNRPR